MSEMPFDNVEKEPAEDIGPGRRLRMAREHKGLTQIQAAESLHLTEGIIQALEDDDYDRLPDAVFVRGYLRKYARLLGEPEDSLLEAFAQLSPKRPKEARLAVSGIRKEVRSSHFLVRLTTWLIIIGLVGLSAVWLRGYFQSPAEQEPSAGAFFEPDETGAGGLEIAEPELAAEQPLPQGFQDEEPAPDTMALEQQKDARSEEPASPQAAVTAPAPLPEEDSEQEPAAPLAGEEAPVIVEAVEAESIEAPAGPAAPAMALAERLSPAEEPRPEEPTASAEGAVTGPVVVFEFDDDCWVDVRDATGEHRILGNKSAGERRVLEDKGPYSVVLGNAGAVRVSIDGRPFDLTPYIRRNVARFTLDPAQASAPSSP